MIKGWGRRVEDILSGSGPDDLGSNPSDSVQTFLERKFDQRNKVFSFTGFLFVKKMCMRAIVRRSRISGEIDAPPSKSYTHRAIAIASLGARTRSELIAPLISEDTEATINAAKSLGAVVELEGGGKKIVIEGVEGRPATPDDVINAQNSGTTLRFFTAISALCEEGASVITGDASLRKRPNGPLLASLNELGAEAFSTKGDGTAPIVIKGKLKGGDTDIDGSISSQFVSALLIACPVAERESHIRAKNLISVPYTRITLEILAKAGIRVEVRAVDVRASHLTFHVPEGRRYDLRTFTVPGDFSSASYLMAAAVLTDSKLRVKNLLPSAQGDSRIVDIMRDMGVDMHWNRSSGVVEVRGGELRGISIDMSENPDLVPTVAVLAAVAEGTTAITGVAHLRYKETNRLSILAGELRKLGVKIKEQADGLLIEGIDRGNLKAAEVHSHGDHRLAMALTLAGLCTHGETVIWDVECASVSYPSFFDDIRRLGADIDIMVMS